jgi:serine/threonine-protein kinase SRPK3
MCIIYRKRLKYCYFNSSQSPDLTEAGIATLGQIIGKLLQFELSSSASAREVLNGPWFDQKTARIRIHPKQI